jgi:hypothetical protein
MTTRCGRGRAVLAHYSNDGGGAVRRADRLKELLQA